MRKRKTQVRLPKFIAMVEHQIQFPTFWMVCMMMMMTITVVAAVAGYVVDVILAYYKR